MLIAVDIFLFYINRKTRFSIESLTANGKPSFSGLVKNNICLTRFILIITACKFTYRIIIVRVKFILVCRNIKIR